MEMTIPKNTWYTPFLPELAAHYHDVSGFTLCGSGWFDGNPGVPDHRKKCKRCEHFLEENKIVKRREALDRMAEAKALDKGIMGDEPNNGLDQEDFCGDQ